MFAGILEEKIEIKSLEVIQLIRGSIPSKYDRTTIVLWIIQRVNHSGSSKVTVRMLLLRD